jgi:hypothetical protein
MEVELWPNNMRLKMKCYWDVLRNTYGTWETFWEHDGNMLGTHCEQKKNKKSPPPLGEKKPEKEKTKCLEPFPWLHEIFILKMIFHHFQFWTNSSF